MRDRIIEDILSYKVIAILRGVEREYLTELANALYDGGIRLLELTFSANGQIDDSYVAENIRILAKEMEGRMWVGAGTVLTPGQAELAHENGAQFIISPDTNALVINKTRELGMVSIPGALTPSEIQQAHLVGADFVKLFPASAFGPSYVKAVTAPLSHIKLLAVGGINEDNMQEYLRAGVKGFGIGGNLIDKSLLATGDYESITERAERYVREVRK